MKINLSCIIIGYNSRPDLELLLQSINKQQFIHLLNIEIIYIDDGSSDSSYELFNNFKLKFNKKSYKFKKNKGRIYAREKGIRHAKGEWIILLNSNLVIEENFFKEYFKGIQLYKEALAFKGLVIYESKDLVFAKYLNNQHRGINHYKQYEKIHFRHLLFDNCIIKSSILKNIKPNYKLKFYGGEELDFSYQYNIKYPNSIRTCKTAIAHRYNYPIYKNHCKRLNEFGEQNFKYLNKELQKEVIKFTILLNSNYFSPLIFNFINKLTLFFYKFKLPVLNYYIIRLGMLSSILGGYYKRIK